MSDGKINPALCSEAGRRWRIRKQEPECLLSCRPRTWPQGEPNGAPPPKRSVIMEFAMTRKETDSPPFAGDAERWAAVQRRDRDADGVFFYSVRTTGVYCRPSCAARLARRENVRFHASCEQAEAAGFRPCKRCRPNEAALAVRRAAAVAKACRLIETAEEMPNLDALAGSAGMSRFHFHRVFKAITGVTPKAYAAARRARRVREALPRSSTVTEAIYGAGFNSSGPFYAKSSQVLGMTPTRAAASGAEAGRRHPQHLRRLGIEGPARIEARAVDRLGHRGTPRQGLAHAPGAL